MLITNTYHSADCDMNHSLVYKIKVQQKKLPHSRRPGKLKWNLTSATWRSRSWENFWQEAPTHRILFKLRSTSRHYLPDGLWHLWKEDLLVRSLADDWLTKREWRSSTTSLLQGEPPLKQPLSTQRHWKSGPSSSQAMFQPVLARDMPKYSKRVWY